jgi:hypothetical protein
MTATVPRITTTPQDLATAVRALDARRARSRHRMIGASEIGECRRRAAYRIAGVKPTNSFVGLQAFLGTEIHKSVLKALQRMYGGHTEVGLQGEQVKGSCDWYNGDVEDLKTVSKGAFEKVLARGAYTKHWYQVVIYAWLISEGLLTPREARRGRLKAGEPNPVGMLRIRYLSRDSGEDVVFERPFTPDLVAEALLWIAEVYDALDEHGSPELVDRDGFGPGVDSFCDWCPFLDACWGPPIDPEVDGEDFTRQARFVDDEGRAAAAVEYDRARADEADAKRRKEFARAQLAGWSGTVSTGFGVSWSGGNERVQIDKDGACDRLVDLGEVVPTRMVRSPRQIRVIRKEV